MQYGICMEVWCHVWDRITTFSCQLLNGRLKNGSPCAIGPLSVCPVCLSVMLVYCGQTVGGCRLVRRYVSAQSIVLDADPAPPNGH